MDRSPEEKEFPSLGDLPVCCHATNDSSYSRSISARVVGEKTRLIGTNSNRLQLSAPQPQSRQVPCASLLSWADAAGKEDGISHVAWLCCGEVPMLEVDFPSKNAIAMLLKSLHERSFKGV